VHWPQMQVGSCVVWVSDRVIHFGTSSGPRSSADHRCLCRTRPEKKLTASVKARNITDIDPDL